MTPPPTNLTEHDVRILVCQRLVAADYPTVM
jgi:hypothetical protein